jgi:hypothetical protein
MLPACSLRILPSGPKNPFNELGVRFPLLEGKFRELTMKLSRNLFSVALASLLLGASAFAAPTTKGTLKLFEPVTVQGKQLAPGQYTVEWNGEGPNVQLSIASGKNAVANVPARVVPVSPKNATSGYSSTKQQDGSTALTNVFFQGKAFELQIADQSATQGTQPSTSGSNQ